ncbi:MAG: sensor domain-containing diguanylate cyclase [Acidobacteriota bacterium]|nr:sensor domain-containing diguanylate cyclase [Acidobacteriota bacterium]
MIGSFTDSPSSAVTILAIVALAAVVLAGAVAIWWLIDRRAVERRVQQKENDLRSVTRRLRRVEAEQQFMTRFVREFPGLTRELSSQKRYRDVPKVLVRTLAQVFRAERAVVILRSQTGGEEALVVAAVFPDGDRITPGIRVPLTEGELGFVAQTQRIMDRADIESERQRSPQLAATSMPDFTPELVAPLALEERTFGLVALSGIHQMPGQAKEILRLVTHVGSLTLHSVSAFLRVKSAADVDSLTGIFNKRVLNFKLGELLFDAERRREPISVFLFDIDHFKNYNDSNGHLAGDDVLRTLTMLLSDYIRTDDIFGRFGGEEFMLILAGRGESEALVAAQKLRQVVEQHDFPNGETQPLGRLTISGGVATYPTDGKRSVDLVQAADEALYRAKQSGRNRVFTASKRGPTESVAES